jgi:hypothetical protein
MLLEQEEEENSSSTNILIPKLDNKKIVIPIRALFAERQITINIIEIILYSYWG